MTMPPKRRQIRGAADTGLNEARQRLIEVRPYSSKERGSYEFGPQGIAADQGDRETSRRPC